MQITKLNLVLAESYRTILPKEFQLMPFTSGEILLRLHSRTTLNFPYIVANSVAFSLYTCLVYSLM